MNNRQRKFMNELADLMQKYNTSFEVLKVYDDVCDMRFNFGSGNVIHMPIASFCPSKLRDMAQTTHNQIDGE